MTTATARGFVSLNYSFTDLSSTGAVISDSANAQSSVDFVYGSGDSQITLAVSNSGQLSSGGFVDIDLRNLTKTILNYTSTVSITGVKGFCIVNNATSKGSNIAVRSTGTTGFTNLFNGGSGNLLIKPTASFMFVDPYGTPTTTGNKNFQIVDVGGSGASYSYTVFGC